MDSTIKSLIITGAAVEDATRSRQKALGVSRKKRLIVKGDEEDTEFIEKAKAIVLAPKQIEQVKPVEVKPVEVKPIEVSNVILKPPKQQRVKLQPKIVQPLIQTDPITRKARRIHLHTGNLNHRFTRAKKVKDDTENKSVESIREYLVQKGVIQPMSKAPERMLRSMYSDFMLLKDQAL